MEDVAQRAGAYGRLLQDCTRRRDCVSAAVVHAFMVALDTADCSLVTRTTYPTGDIANAANCGSRCSDECSRADTLNRSDECILGGRRNCNGGRICISGYICNDGRNRGGWQRR
eukprot:IDg1525t1